MEHIKRFLRGKGFAVALVACALAAAVAGLWAVRVIRDELQKELDGLQSPSGSQQAEQSLNETEDADQWQQQTAPAAQSTANVPKTESGASSASAGNGGGGSAASGSASASGAVSEPRELRTDSASAGTSASRSATRPVAGRILNAYSGDELVYSATLGDWRTHNGTDYACAEGETVVCPVAGKVTQIITGGNWGEAIEIRDSSGRIWRLCGVTKQKVKQGDAVTAGQALGKAGTVSCECAEASHIHVEVLEGDSYIDPAMILG